MAGYTLHTKEEMLPITTNELGFVQKAAWHHVDRAHEEVVELDSPYALSVAAGTQVVLAYCL